MKASKVLQTIVATVVVVQLYYMYGFDRLQGQAKEAKGAVQDKAEVKQITKQDGPGDIAQKGVIQFSTSGKGMPVVGFGTAGLGSGTKQAVLEALKAGYTHIDSAMAREWYREDLVGQALREAGVDRHGLWITTKVHPKNLGTESTRAAVMQSLQDLGTDYIDLLLLHYPKCFGNLCPTPPEGTWRDSWRVMEDLQSKGKIRFLGVSNFGVSDLKELWEFAAVKPNVVQTHSDPMQPNTAVQDFCKAHGIQFEAYSSLGTQHMMRSADGKNPIMTHPDILRVADKYGVSPGVVVLRWALHAGQVVIPRSRNPEHIKQNLQATSLQLTPQEYEAIDALSKR